VIEWILTTVGLAQLRLRHGEPYLRLAVILGGVTLFTALAALVLQHPMLRKYFGMTPSPGAEPGTR
jgi:hypothetical protein